ncbi:hypothetical protein E2542_SST24836 [Spatholobus suberectus]|nr:hypothetical protein E2542_SST24836 [Spatholobus suberectus]
MQAPFTTTKEAFTPNSPNPYPINPLPTLHSTSDLQEKNNKKTPPINSFFHHKPSRSPTYPQISLSIMDMKKFTCAVLIAAASMSAALATTQVPAPAPGPSSGASATAVGSLVGASVLSFLALFY